MLLGCLWTVPGQHGKGRRSGRPFFFLAVAVSLLGGAPGSGQGETGGTGIHPLIQGVRIVPPAPGRGIEVSGAGAAPHVLPGTHQNPVGRGLLRFYGCVTCHDLPVKPFAPRRGPDLDRVGEKTTGAWLKRWLPDPAALAPDAKMPRVPLTGEDLDALVAFLMAQRGRQALPEAGRGDAIRGKALYGASECGRCHRLAGEGDDRAPALDRAGEKIRRPWLVAYLMDPSSMVPNTTMPFFGFSQAQAEDLAAYLLGAGGPPDEASFASADDQEGLSAFAQGGCAGCHRIGAYTVRLALPSTEKAAQFLSHHATAGTGSPKVALREAQTEAMAAALVGNGEGEAVDAEAFLSAFWETPIALQGTAPAAYDSAATGLHPEACGTCHPMQFADWQTTVHSQSMGPGVVGQLLDGLWQNPGFAGGCQACHAPASEQHAMVTGERGEYEHNYLYDSTLQKTGLSCVVCHVRAHVRYGPPPGPRAAAQVWRGPGHGGAVVAPVFETSEFCRECHQFGPDAMRLNGKLLQDTYAEWLESPQAAEGQTCQNCHMPDRRHLWRGIHDPEMVREAVKVEVELLQNGSDSVAVEVGLANVGAAHHLPTYVTPLILVRARLLKEDLSPLAGSGEERAIGRRITLSVDQELFDSRIPAGGRWVWRYEAEKRPGAKVLEVSAEVHPDHFYLGFFEAYNRESLSPGARAMIDSAEANARRSPYRLFVRRWPLAELEASVPIDH